MKMRFNILTLIMAIALCCNAQNEKKKRLEDFLFDLQNSKKSSILLIEDHLKSSEEISTEHKSLLKLVVESIRNKISDKEFLLHSKRQKPNLFETIISENDPDEQFVVTVEDEIITYFLVKDSTIKSISTINKGGRKFYVFID